MGDASIEQSHASAQLVADLDELLFLTRELPWGGNVGLPESLASAVITLSADHGAPLP